MEKFTTVPTRSSESPTQEEPCDLTSDDLQRLEQQRKILFPSPSGEDTTKEHESATSTYIQQLLKTSCSPIPSSSSSSPPPTSSSTVDAMSKSFLYRSSPLSKSSVSAVQPSLYGWMLNSGTWKGHYTHRRRRWGYHLGQDFRALHTSRYNALYRRSALGSCSSLYRPGFASQAPPPPLLPLQSSEGHSAADILGKVPPPLLPLSEDALQDAVLHSYTAAGKSRVSPHHVPYAGMVMGSPSLCDSSSHHHHHHLDAAGGSSSRSSSSGSGVYLDSTQSSHYHAACQSTPSLQSQLHLSKWQYQPYPPSHSSSRADQRCCDRLCPLRHSQQPTSSPLYSLHGSGSRSSVCGYASSPFDVARQSLVNLELPSQSSSHLPFANTSGVVPPLPPPPPLPPHSMHDEVAKSLTASHLHCRH